LYEFKDSEIPYHKCEVLDTVKVSNTRVHLVCVICKKVIGMWEDTLPPMERKNPGSEAKFFSESTIKEYV